MGEAFISRRGGGGASLNFSVKAYASDSELPSVEKENTIAVITDAEITSWIFSATQPATPSEGMVWISTGISSAIQFNALKKNGIEVYPIDAQQYTGSAWVAKTAKSYMNGAWVDWIIRLFENGWVNTDATGGINGTITSTAINFPARSIVNADSKAYTTNKAIDITNFKTIKAKFSSNCTHSGIFFRLALYNTVANGAKINVEYLPAHADITADKFTHSSQDWSLDISAMKGSYYLGYAWGVYNSTGSAKDVAGNIFEWWVE